VEPFRFTPLENPTIQGGDDINKTSIPLVESSRRHRKAVVKAPSFKTGFTKRRGSTIPRISEE